MIEEHMKAREENMSAATDDAVEQIKAMLTAKAEEIGAATLALTGDENQANQDKIGVVMITTMSLFESMMVATANQPADLCEIALEMFVQGGPQQAVEAVMAKFEAGRGRG